MNLVKLKLTGFCQCHAVLFQYIEFLRSAYEPDDLAAEVPTISDLMERWGIEAAVAFDIARPKLRAAMKVRHVLFFHRENSLLTGRTLDPREGHQGAGHQGDRVETQGWLGGEARTGEGHRSWELEDRGGQGRGRVACEREWRRRYG
mgnify:FL=1